MPVYWMFLCLSFLVWIWYSGQYRMIMFEGNYERRPLAGQYFLFFGILIFFCGLRSGIADTGTYIQMFESYPENVSGIEWSTVDGDKGFYFISVLYKQFISTDYHGWLLLFTVVSGIATMIGFKKFSEEFGMTCFLFIATTMFVYLVNGMRQYTCVAILLAASDWIYQRKYIRFVILVLLLSTIHASVLIFIPLLLLINAKAWSPRMALMILVAIFVGVCWEQLLPTFGVLLANTTYEEYAGYLTTSATGSSIFRLFIALIPVGLAFMGRRTIAKMRNPFINLAVNMSVINACLYLVATVSSGMVIGRIAVYFDIYNLILLPWMLKNLFTKNSEIFLRIACIGAYLVYFYYQMVIVWQLPYESDILGLML